MEIKKNPKSNLENYSKLFIQLGLVLTLFVVYVAIENKTYDKSIDDLGMASMADDIEEETVITQRIEPPKPKTPPPPTPEKIEVIEDEKDVEETVIESTESDEDLEVEEIIEEAEEEEVVSDVPFAIIEEVPIFPGCTGTRKQKADCLSSKIRKHMGRKFNADLAGDLGLSSGKKKIWISFRISEKGNITDIKARAPHPRLKKEALRITKLLPKMTPGKQRGRPVGMKYSVPISFNVE